MMRVLKATNAEKFDSLVYNAKSKDSRRLADWWEEHEKADIRHQEEDFWSQLNV